MKIKSYVSVIFKPFRNYSEEIIQWKTSVQLAAFEDKSF